MTNDAAHNDGKKRPRVRKGAEGSLRQHAQGSAAGARIVRQGTHRDPVRPKGAGRKVPYIPGVKRKPKLTAK